MSLLSLNVTEPHATPYDSEHPTRSTENYSHALHDILQDMEDAGPWYIFDGVPVSQQITNMKAQVFIMLEAVFDYAAGAIETYRETGTATLAKPSYVNLTPLDLIYTPAFGAINAKLYVECASMMWKVYYMWKTEEDPLLLKEKLQELLVAWPLTDTEIILSEEGGQTLKIVPAWKNVDI